MAVTYFVLGLPFVALLLLPLTENAVTEATQGYEAKLAPWSSCVMVYFKGVSGPSRTGNTTTFLSTLDKGAASLPCQVHSPSMHGHTSA